MIERLEKVGCEKQQEGWVGVRLPRPWSTSPCPPSKEGSDHISSLRRIESGTIPSRSPSSVLHFIKHPANSCRVFSHLFDIAGHSFCRDTDSARDTARRFQITNAQRHAPIVRSMALSDFDSFGRECDPIHPDIHSQIEQRFRLLQVPVNEWITTFATCDLRLLKYLRQSHQRCDNERPPANRAHAPQAVLCKTFLDRLWLFHSRPHQSIPIKSGFTNATHDDDAIHQLLFVIRVRLFPFVFIMVITRHMLGCNPTILKSLVASIANPPRYSSQSNRNSPNLFLPSRRPPYDRRCTGGSGCGSEYRSGRATT